MVHTVQVEESLQPFRRLGQATVPFVRPRAEIVAEPTPEFANATLKKRKEKKRRKGRKEEESKRKGKKK